MGKKWDLFLIFSILIGFSLYAAEEKINFQRLVCIFDRGVIAQTIPSGSLYAFMGKGEACKNMLISCLKERVPVLVSAHVMKNLYDHLRYSKFKFEDIQIEMIKVLLRIDPVYMDAALPETELKRAAEWARTSKQREHENLKIKELLSNQLIFQTVSDNVQMLLILPCDAPVAVPERAAVLSKAGFNQQTFKHIGSGCTVLKKIFEHMYDAPEKIKAIEQPISISELDALFVDDGTLRRNIVLVGHGSIGRVAQMSMDNYDSFLHMLGTKKCASLGLLSCYASAPKNRTPYKGSLRFPIFLFSVGDTVSFATTDNTLFSLTKYFEGIEEYICHEQGDAHDIASLKKALAYIHCNVPNNTPWIYFPGREGLVSEFDLVKIKSPILVQAASPELHVPDVAATAPEPQGATLQPVPVNKDTLLINDELIAELQKADASLEITDKRFLYVYVKTISTPIIFEKTVPQIFSMVNDISYFNCFGSINLKSGHVCRYLTSLLYALRDVKLTTVIGSISCDNHLDFCMGDTVAPEDRLLLEHVIIRPVFLGGHEAKLFLVLYRLGNDRKFYKLEYMPEERPLTRKDDTQRRIKSEYCRYVMQLKAKQCDDYARALLDRMLLAAQERPSAPGGELARDPSCQVVPMVTGTEGQGGYDGKRVLSPADAKASSVLAKRMHHSEDGDMQ
jgi:hypothetical protein